MIKIKKILTCLVFLAFVMPVFVSATDYYIDIDSIGGLCSDLNSGTNITEPWCSIRRANSELQEGDTVYIRGGIYQDANTGGAIINPWNSGTPGNYITYQNYGNETVILTNTNNSVHAINLDSKSYIKIDGIDAQTPIKYWVYLHSKDGSECSYNIIQNCNFNETTSSVYAGILIGGGTTNPGNSHHNIIRNCTFYGKTDPADSIMIRYGASYNLVENCTFNEASHVSVELQSAATATCHHNIIRNNIIRNTLHTCINVYGGADWNVVENNVIIDAGEADKTETRYLHGGIQLEGSNNIIRKNIMYNCGRMAVENYGGDGCDNNRIYHNTFYENYRDWDSVTGEDVDGNVAKNNIFWASRQKLIEHDVQGANRDDYFINNCMKGNGELIMWWPDGGDLDIEYMETNYPSLWYGNIDLNPNFIDALNRDFHLQSNSPCIDAGAWLTTTISGGSGTDITVDDAKYFIDSRDIIEGDIIQLEGQSITAKIIAIDYNNNILKVNTPLTWFSGQGVSLAYQDSSPDIGAYEYMSGEPPQTCSDNTLYSQCSATLPLYCDNGTLIDYCSQCGCPTNYTCMVNESCMLCTPADLNCDGVVDIQDLTIIATNFGLTASFDLRADTDNNNVIDIFDIVFVASRFT